MAGPRIAQTPLDIAASKGAHALMAWLNVIPTVARPERTDDEHRHADHLTDVLEEQVEAIKQAREDA